MQPFPSGGSLADALLRADAFPAHRPLREEDDMRIGILSARSSDYHPNRRLTEAAAEMGHEAVLLHPKDCLQGVDGGGMTLTGTAFQGFPDILLPRIGATISDYALSLIRHFEGMSIPVVNGFQAVLLARNKFLSLQTLARKGVAVPETYYATNIEHFEAAAERLGGYPVVAKTPNSRQGEGVVLVETPFAAGFILHNLTDKRQGLLVQEYLPPRNRRDLRAFVLGDRVVAAMALRPDNGDFRSNIHLKGHGEPAALDREQAALAVRATRALGLEISGTDIIMVNGSPKILEVNYSPGFRGLEAVVGQDIACQVIDYLVSTYGEAA